MRNFWDEFGAPLTFIMGLFAVIGGAITAIAVAVDYTSCKGFERGTGYEVRWSWGCYAKLPDGTWVPEKYVFGQAHELRMKEKK